MNAILKECEVERQPGMKMADKAALIVQKVPRDRLLNFLENPAEGAPAKKKSRTDPIVLPSNASTSLARYFGSTEAKKKAKQERLAAKQAAVAKKKAEKELASEAKYTQTHSLLLKVKGPLFLYIYIHIYLYVCLYIYTHIILLYI